jgi:nitroimidazol reductase NimA-like FMN-containing flavoprotein (pyridoxamine 5'-phosphate oxidase superfamily)
MGDFNIHNWQSQYVKGQVNEAVDLSKEQKIVEAFLKRIAKEFDYSIEDAARFVKQTISKMNL